MCKVNNAHNVKIILPTWQREELNESRSPRHSCASYDFDSSVELARKEVDIYGMMYIIIFTLATLLNGEEHNGEAIAQRSQTRQSASARHPQPAPADRDRRVVRARRVLRCARLSASQVRDASSGAERRPACFHNCGRVWLLSSFVLPSSVGVPASGFGGAHTTATGPQGSSQTHPGNPRVPSTSTPAECRAADRAIRGSGPAKIPKAGSSTNHRAGTRTQSKKTAPAPVETMTAISKTCHHELTAHYEQLRDDALSLTAGHQPTLGLDLLLRRGMAAWIQA
jgi:hypothetical protein